MTPYEQFLDIPESETPPDYYRLLGIPRFTSDPKLIHNAAVERNRLLRSWDNSKFYREADALLDEVIAAAAVLEDPVNKAAYDARLRRGAAPLAADEIVFEPFDASDDDEVNLPEKTPATPTANASIAAVAVPSLFLTPQIMMAAGGLVTVAILVTAPILMQRGAPPVVAPPSLAVSDDVPPADPDRLEARTDTPLELLDPIDNADSFTAIALSSDGRQIVTANRDHSLTLWDATTRQAISTFEGHTGPVHCVTFSLDGNWLGSCGDDLTFILWHKPTVQPIHMLKVHSSPVRAIALSYDTNRAVTGSDDGTVMLLDMFRGRDIFTLAGHSSAVNTVACSPNGRFFASAADDGEVKIWSSVTGDTLRILRGHAGAVRCIAFGPDSIHVAAAGDDQTMSVWGADNDKPVSALHGHEAPVVAVAFDQKGGLVASASRNGNIKAWDWSVARQVDAWKEDLRVVTSIVFRNKGKELVVAGSDQGIAVHTHTLAGTESASTERDVSLDWGRGKVRARRTLDGHNREQLTGASFFKDGTRLLSSDMKYVGKIWETSTGRELSTVSGLMNWHWSPAVSRDGKLLAASEQPYDGLVTVWDLEMTRKLHTLRHPRGAWSVAFDADASRLVTACHDGQIRIWNPITGVQVRNISAHAGGILGLAFTIDGKRLASAGRNLGDKPVSLTAKLWDTESGLETFDLKGHQQPLLKVAFSPDGSRLATSSLDKTVRIWDVFTGQAVRELKPFPDSCHPMAFSPDNRWLATAGRQFLMIWDTTTGQVVQTMEGQSSNVVSVDFNPDGSLLASASTDGLVTLWEVVANESGADR